MQIVIRLLADGLLLPIGVVALYALILKAPKRQRYDRYTRVVMAGVSSYLLAKYAGALWQPAKLRPFEQLGVSAGASSLNNPGFPSDHALFAMFLTLAVWYVSRDIRLTLVMALMTVVMCIGRVMARVHTPLDVIGGMAIACFGAVWYLHDKDFLQNPLAKKSKR